VLRLAVAGAVRPPRALPPVLFYDELAALPGDAWLGFQAALLARDRRAAPQRPGCPKPARTHRALRTPRLPGRPGDAGTALALTCRPAGLPVPRVPSYQQPPWGL